MLHHVPKVLKAFWLLSPYFFFFYFFLLLCKYSCLHFPPPLPPTPPIPTSHPWSYPLWFCPCVLYTCSWKPFPFPPVIPSHLPSGYCQFVLNFSVSGYILLACLFCWLGSTYRWDHMVFRLWIWCIKMMILKHWTRLVYLKWSHFSMMFIFQYIAEFYFLIFC